MENRKKEIRKLKLGILVTAAVFAVLFLALFAAGAAYSHRHSFSTEAWVSSPEKRTGIVDDLLRSYDLVGMTPAQVEELLGTDYNSRGYFEQENRFVYYLGDERGLISIDSEWLILDFDSGVVVDFFITTD